MSIQKNRIILTGGIASGKSTVGNILKEKYGYEIIDADKISHDIFRENIEEIKVLFGLENEETQTSRQIKKFRQKISRKIFNNEKDKFILESFLHPKISEQMEKEYNNKKGQKVIFDIPLYFEKSEKKSNDFVICLSIDYGTQVERLIERDYDKLDLPEEDIMHLVNKKLLSQFPTAIKQKKSDYVIYNNSDFDALNKEVESLIKRLENG